MSEGETLMDQTTKSTTYLVLAGVVTILKREDPKMEEECCVCLEALKPIPPQFRLPLIIKNCGHAVHEHCLCTVLLETKSPFCPMCRQNMFQK